MGSEVEAAPQSVVDSRKKRSTRGGVKLRLKKERQRAAAEAAEAVNHTAAPTAASGQPPDVVGRRRRGGGQGRGGSHAAAAANSNTVTSAPQRSVQPAPGQGPVATKLIPKPRPVSVPLPPTRTQQTVAHGSAVPVHAHNGPVARAPAPPVPAGGAHFNAHRPAAKAPAPPPAPGPAPVLPARTEPVSRPPGPRYVVATQGSVVWGDAFGAAGQQQAGVSPMEEDVQQRNRMHHHTPAWSVHMNHGGHVVMDGMNGGHGMHGGRVASPPIVASPGDYSSHFASPQPPQQAPLPLLPSSPFMPTPQPPQPPMGAPFVGLPAVLFPQASYPPPFQQHGGDVNGWMPQQQMAPPPFMGQQHFGGAPMAYATQQGVYMQHQQNTLMF